MATAKSNEGIQAIKTHHRLQVKYMTYGLLIGLIHVMVPIHL